MPYPHEVNDIPMIAIHHGTAPAFADMIVDNFDEMLEQSRAQPLVFGIALHAFLVGQPFRLRHLRRALEHVARHRAQVWLATTGAIAQHFMEHVPSEVVSRGRDLRAVTARATRRGGAPTGLSLVRARDAR